MLDTILLKIKIRRGLLHGYDDAMEPDSIHVDVGGGHVWDAFVAE